MAEVSLKMRLNSIKSKAPILTCLFNKQKDGIINTNLDLRDKILQNESQIPGHCCSRVSLINKRLSLISIEKIGPSVI